MYPLFDIDHQIFDIVSAANRISELIPQDLKLQIIDLIINTITSLDTEGLADRESLVSKISSINFVSDVKIHDSGIYIYFKQFLLLIDNQSISAIEPFDLLDRVYARTKTAIYVLKLFKELAPERANLYGYTLGITREGHDSSAAIINNITGEILAFEREERITRVKPTRDFPVQAIRDVLIIADIRADQINFISIGHNIHWFEDARSSSSPAGCIFTHLGKQFMKKDFGTRHSCAYIVRRIKEAIPEIDLRTTPIYFVRHHLAHAASMPQQRSISEPSLFLVMDGRGEWDTITVWLLEQGDFRNVIHIGMPDSLGYLYNMMGRYMGWRVFGFEGQIMGLAPYGEPRTRLEKQIYDFLTKEFREFAQLFPEPPYFKLDRRYFDGGYSTLRLLNLKGWVSPFIPSKYFVDLLSRYMRPLPAGTLIDPDNPRHRSICILAYSIQTRTREIILALINHLKCQFPNIKRLYISGGVALNVSINGEIIEKGLFTNENLITTPVAGDDGLSIGAAQYLLRYYFGRHELPQSFCSALLGREYDQLSVKSTLDRFGLVAGESYYEFQAFDDLVDSVADLLFKNNGIAWYQGREEAGPRALGARSILFPITDPSSGLRANRAKQRQLWRPCAISILSVDASEFLIHCITSPYMTIAFRAASTYRGLIRGGLHPADESTRPQTVTIDCAPHLYRLLEVMKARDGIGAVINTSFNRGEPIVHWPDDALDTLFYLTGVNYLAISNYLVRKGRYTPSIISAKDEPSLKESFSKYNKTGDLGDFLDKLVNYIPASYQLSIVLEDSCRLPMFREAFDFKNFAGLLNYFIHSDGYHRPVKVKFEPLNDPHLPALFRLLDRYNREVA